METKHTKGIWIPNEKNQIECRNKMGKLMARFEQFTPIDFHKNAEANAKLIAAAPEMLSALMNICYCNSLNMFSEIQQIEIKKGIEAIKKATE